jgi:hypothetical protein
MKESKAALIVSIKTPEEAKHFGYAGFNGGEHVCISIGNAEHTTISVITPHGKKVTFAFCPAPEDRNDDFQCIDILYHNSGLTVENGDKQIPAQCAILFKPGQPIASAGPKDGCSLLSLSLRKETPSDNVKA